jgi:hypothetical protein
MTGDLSEELRGQILDAAAEFRTTVWEKKEQR